MTAPADSYRYDVFISYRQQEPDLGWVRKKLLPRLQSAGVKVCIDFLDFEFGATLIKEMERAVEQSRYTLAVLTPRYLESNFTDLENVLADQLGLERSERRLLMLSLERTTPRLGMRARVWLDMSNADDFESRLQQLTQVLQNGA